MSTAQKYIKQCPSRHKFIDQKVSGASVSKCTHSFSSSPCYPLSISWYFSHTFPCRLAPNGSSCCSFLIAAYPTQERSKYDARKPKLRVSLLRLLQNKVFKQMGSVYKNIFQILACFFVWLTHIDISAKKLDIVATGLEKEISAVLLDFFIRINPLDKSNVILLIRAIKLYRTVK